MRPVYWKSEELRACATSTRVVHAFFVVKSWIRGGDGADITLVVPGYPHHIPQRRAGPIDIFSRDEDRVSFLGQSLKYMPEEAERFGHRLSVPKVCLS